MNAGYNLNFHQTFAPEREYLSKLLELADGTTPMTKEDIFERTGIPTGKQSGKVEPHIAYAVYMGLLEDTADGATHKLTRTELGESVYSNDPHLLEPLTLLVCHYNLSSPPSGAALWQFIFQKAVAGLGQSVPQKSLGNAASVEFPGIRVGLTPVKTCYTTEKCLGLLGLLDVTPDKTWVFSPVTYQSDYRHAYSYTLLKTWDEVLPNRKEVTLDEVLTDLHWSRPFLWGERETWYILDSLNDLGLIALNKQLTPITLIRRSTCSAALSSMYSNLL